MKKALTIAGSDSGGGAGIQADLKTFHNLGVYGMSAITALTAQNTTGVQGIFNVSPEFLSMQIRSCLSDIGADSVKTGMLSTPPLVESAAQTLQDFKVKYIVVDPVMVAKSGDRLLEDSAVKTVIDSLLPLATIITPNAEEAQIIAGMNIITEEDMKRSAEKILNLGPKSVLIKGGHLDGDKSIDLFYDGKSFTRLESERFENRHTHGTGCTLSSAIAAFLALGYTLTEAVKSGKRYITLAIKKAEALGKGIGPVNHLAMKYFMKDAAS